jgi:hypothetical protein
MVVLINLGDVYMEIVVARFPQLRKVTESDGEILVHGHVGVWEVSDERFAKPPHRLSRCPHSGDILILRNEEGE